VILVIGGAASGKRSYVRSLGYTDEQMADAALDERPVIYNLQDMVGACLARTLDRNPAKNGRQRASEPSGETRGIAGEVFTIPALLEPLLSKEVVICNEVGAGVIPVDRLEREGRETTGRLCNQLAQQANRVVRLVAGIPMVIKG
jgi:adenosyl cobinamide kinase/adenosyl cobinamide phosphate guanylyltransferase